MTLIWAKGTGSLFRIRSETRGNMAYDLRQRFVLDYGYVLPSGKASTLVAALQVQSTNYRRLESHRHHHI